MDQVKSNLLTLSHSSNKFVAYNRDNGWSQRFGKDSVQIGYSKDIIKIRAVFYYSIGNLSCGNQIISQGGHGTVYKGTVDNTIEAVKKSKVMDRDQIEQIVNEDIVLKLQNY